MSESEFLRNVAVTVRDSLVRRPSRFDRKVFLGGAAPGTPGSIRSDLADGLSKLKTGSSLWSRDYDIYYPETLFDGLMSGPGRIDLLTLENTLAKAVDAVILIIESPGAQTELGAFANNDRLRPKLVIVQKERYRKRKSFISQGPIRLIRDRKEGHVIYANFDDLPSLVKKVHHAVSQIRKAHPVTFDLSNVLHSHNLIPPCLWVFESLSRDQVASLIRFATDMQHDVTKQAGASAIAILLRTRQVAIDADGRLYLTEEGLREFLQKGRWLGRTAKYNRDTLDRIRIDVLSRQRRKLRKW